MKTKNDQKLYETLLSFKRKTTELFLKDAKEYSLSPSHFEVLVYLTHNGQATMKGIATWLNITPPSVSALVEKLVEKNLVKRINDDKDRRIVQITLGEEARKIFANLNKKKDVFFDEMLNKLDEKDKEDLTRIINKCIV